MGMSFSSLVEVTDVPVDELQPGVANRLKNGGIQTDSLDDARSLVEDYRDDIAVQDERATAGERAADSSSSSAAASSGSRTSAHNDDEGEVGA